MASSRGLAGDKKLRWYQFELRTLLVLVLVVAGLLSWWRWRAVEAQRDAAEQEAIVRLGYVEVEYVPHPSPGKWRPDGLLEARLPPGSDDSRIGLLAHVRRCRRIILRGTALDDAGLALAIKPKGIERLDLTGTAVTEDGIRQLILLGSLRELVLDHTPLGDGCVEALGRIPQLELVSLRGTHVTAEGAGKLEASAPGLRVLWATAPSEAQRQVAAALEAREVRVDAQRTETGATTYGVTFGRERRLIGGQQAQLMPVDPTPFLTELARLDVSRITLRGLPQGPARLGIGDLLGGLEHLRELRLEGESIALFATPTDARQIARLTNLTRLSLFRCCLANRELAPLATMPNLEEFVLERPSYYVHDVHNNGKVIEPRCVNNEGLVHFRSMKRLRRLALRDVRTDDRTRATAPQRGWAVQDMEINDAGMEHLAALAELESLDLSGTPVTAAGLLKLRGLKKLRELVLGDIPLSDDQKADLQAAFPQATLSFGRSDGQPEEEPLP